MADPLSIAASVVGVTVPALEATRLLLDTLSEIKDAPKTITRLSDEVQAVDATLNLLRGVGDREWSLLGSTVAEQSKTIINSSKEACDHFRGKLQQWGKHSDDGKLAWRDRANVGIFKKTQIKATSEQLQNCKLSINNVISIATLYVSWQNCIRTSRANSVCRYSSVRNSHITEEIRESISVRQNEVNEAITATDRQIIVLEDRVNELELSSDEEEGRTFSQERSEAQQRLENERDALDASKKLLQELLTKAREEAVQQAALGGRAGSTTITFGNQNSGFQAGIVNGNVNSQTSGAK
jgi:Asp/Glu/hydantoin racemase